MHKREPRRLALFMPSLRGGGAERVMVLLANSFASAGFAVDLVLVAADGPYRSEVSPQVRIVDLGASRSLSALPKLVRYLKQEHPYAMLTTLSHANVLAVVAKKLAKAQVRLVLREANNLSASKTAGLFPGSFLWAVMRMSYPLADAIVAVSTGVALDLSQTLRIPSGSITVVHNPVDSAAYRGRAADAVQHSWLNEKRCPVIVAAGRLVPAKDFSTLISAFAKVRLQRECRLLILGEGQLRGDLERLARKFGVGEHVELVGFQKNPHAWISRADLFVLSSQREGFPNVLLEAMALGTPVVSTDCPSGPAEILESGKWGALVPVGDVEAMAKAIDSTLAADTNPPVEKRADHFSVERGVGRYLSLLVPDGPFP